MERIHLDRCAGVGSCPSVLSGWTQQSSTSVVLLGYALQNMSISYGQPIFRGDTPWRQVGAFSDEFVAAVEGSGLVRSGGPVCSWFRLALVGETARDPC
ncbi:uncharacterized protein GLRG_02282 [Colletotrichum graminicola M1.001]|uniref:Uncharacterized protein n=1 Tax=Colletotrichum graminicola (strain M1.001 / M2 / FGSC 10212) TaxID=645133 RepID=E3Q899_COLGM|nr:uncharacterized protein GLRG_02282 [Colletotrichum graminicola M1.001]EFQ27111.1 hypothetical protein GLRG_02282 [Colletotrichum graminicola M1.001]